MSVRRKLGSVTFRVARLAKSAAFAMLLVLLGGQHVSLSPPEHTQKLTKETLEKLNQLSANTKIPESAQILLKRRSKIPFQGSPFDGLYNKDLPKQWKGLTPHELMLAWGWINPGAESYITMSTEGRKKLMEEKPNPDDRGWFYPSFDPVRKIQELILRFWTDTG